MEPSGDLDWSLFGEYINHESPAPLTSGSQIATQCAEASATVSRQRPFPLLRLSDCEEGKFYDRENPICIHYNIEWKVSQYTVQKKRATETWRGQETNIVLAPGDIWKKSLEKQINDFVIEKLGDSTYTRKGANVTISIENSRGGGLRAEYHDNPIQWDNVNDHLEVLETSS
ncbi:unnamed protein product [Clonostachys rosea f. rosea IK726]|uniref:Uncharacterized protein n=1 Tax=Clonostachys rosea f. rosea IK726 TaxID=1349383 RepID=A0ACA9USY1_BIOOC|nr:unnamed protein product [Clonostachys rosea f. rosea IK726]